MKLLLLVNTSASSVTARGKVVIQKALSADHDVHASTTNRRGHATRLARAAADDGVDVVVVLGGDGTLNEAANGLVGTNTALAALPGGSTNVFARTLGLSDDPVEATGQLIDALHRHDIESVGLGHVADRYFLFHVGVGFDAELVRQVERRATMKRWASHPLFVYAGLLAYFKHYDHGRPRFSVTLPDGSAIDDSRFSVVFNTNPYTYVGTRPFNAAPDATLDRGLAVLSFRDMAAGPLLGLMASALNSGRHLRASRRTHYAHDLDGVVIDAFDPVPYQMDGDFLGEVTRLEFRYVPDILRLVRP